MEKREEREQFGSVQRTFHPEEGVLYLQHGDKEMQIVKSKQQWITNKHYQCSPSFESHWPAMLEFNI